LVSETCTGIARRIKRGADRRAKKDAGGLELAVLLTGEITRDDVSLLAFADAADGHISAVELEKAFAYPALTAVSQQLFAALLVKSNTRKLNKIRASFAPALALALGGSERLTHLDGVAEKLVQALETHFVNVIAGLEAADTEEPIPELVGRLVLIEATLDSVDASLKELESRASSDQEDFETWLTKYRRQCVKAHGSLTPPDFKERNAVPIDDIYVPGRISNDAAKYLGSEETVFDLIPQIDREVLLGDPGGGKSTSTHAIAHRLAKDEEGIVPFVVVLRDYAPKINELSVVEFIEQRLRVFYQADPTGNAVESLLREGRALVLFDGLDELLDATRRVEVAQRVELFSSLYPAAKIFVTSRKVGYKEARLDPTVFSTHELSAYDDDDVESYIRKWFALQSDDDGAVEEIVASFLSESAAIPDLRSNPLLLALLCIIYRGQGYLPKNRVGIYEECSKLLFQTWDKSRGLNFDFSFERHLADALKHLAYWMFTADTGTEGVEEFRLVEELSNFFEGRAYETGEQARVAAEQFIEFCRGRGWVLSDAGTTVEGISLFKFTHRTFMEYFAAYQLTRLNPAPQKLARELLPHVSRNGWDTVGQLAIHLINESADQGAEKALAQMLDSSKRRSVEYRENVLAFVARCLDYLSVSPSFVRRAVRESLEVLRQAAEKSERETLMQSMSWINFCYLESESDGAVEDEVEQLCLQWIEENSSISRIAALVVITGIQFSPVGRLHRQTARADAWTRRMHTAVCERASIFLTNGDPWVKDAAFLLYLRNLIDFSTFRAVHAEPGDAPLDYLFRSFENLDRSKSIRRESETIWPYLIGPRVFVPSTDDSFPEKVRYIYNLIQDVSADLLDRDLSVPLLKEGDLPEFWAFFGHEMQTADEDLTHDERAVRLLLCCAAVDRFPALTRHSQRGSMLISELEGYVIHDEPLPKKFDEVADRSSEPIKNLLKAWARDRGGLAIPVESVKRPFKKPSKTPTSTSRR
jgi:hypothetical protein